VQADDVRTTEPVPTARHEAVRGQEACSGVALGSSTANSSPPIRATTSPLRTASLSARPRRG
jgi:hypothetical protein